MSDDKKSVKDMELEVLPSTSTVEVHSPPQLPVTPSTSKNKSTSGQQKEEAVEGAQQMEQPSDQVSKIKTEAAIAPKTNSDNAASINAIENADELAGSKSPDNPNSSVSKVSVAVLSRIEPDINDKLEDSKKEIRKLNNNSDICTMFGGVMIIMILFTGYYFWSKK